MVEDMNITLLIIIGVAVVTLVALYVVVRLAITHALRTVFEKSGQLRP
jgi:hypothetical protein